MASNGNNFVHWYLEDRSSRVVSESGIPSDRWHVGKILLHSFKETPNLVVMIDAATSEQALAGEFLQKSVNCATALRHLGLEIGDVIAVIAPNHLDTCVPLYAAMYLGVKVSCIDRSQGIKELTHSFNTIKPKVVFCQNEKTSEINKALKQSNNSVIVIDFDKDSYSQLLKKGTMDVSEFKANDFDAANEIAFLIATSGSTGLPKSASITHQYVITNFAYFYSHFDKYPEPFKTQSVIAPLQWMSTIGTFILAPILRFTTVISSSEATLDSIHDIISTYKISFTIMSPQMAVSLIRNGTKEQKKNLTYFKAIVMGGSPVTMDVVREFQEVSPNTQLVLGYGMTETGPTHFNWNAADGTYLRTIGLIRNKLVNPETGEEVTKANVLGELWVSGPTIFKGYYNNPEATKEAFTEDGWFKTGDLFYLDESKNLRFADRLKIMLNYKSHKISPAELEGVIRGHPSVVDAAVTGLPDPECVDLPVALVVCRSGHHVTEREIKDLVKNSLSEPKQLHGGVFFVEALPLTPSSKFDRKKLKEIAISMKNTKSYL